MKPLQTIPTIYYLAQILSQLDATISSSASTPAKSKCTVKTDQEKGHLNDLRDLWGQTYAIDFKAPPTSDQPRQTYTYYIGICASPCPASLKPALDCGPNDAVVQTWKDGDKLQSRVVGRFNETFIQGSDRWKMMTYDGGDKYRTHCVNNRERKAHIMFTCDETLGDFPSVTVLEENNQGNDSCYYLMEIASGAICPPSQSILPAGVSAGSVIVILFVIIVSCYLVFGCLYRRILLGAKGADQMPNLYFWQDLGNLMADGCDFVFRTKEGSRNVRSVGQHSTPGSGGGYEPVSSNSGSRVYKGLGDDILSNSQTGNSGGGGVGGGGGSGGLDSADDSLLPM